jgi:hypothetical protein
VFFRKATGRVLRPVMQLSSRGVFLGPAEDHFGDKAAADVGKQ